MAILMATTLGERVRKLRTDAGLTQKELADAAGVRRQAIVLIERDKFAPRWDTVVALARALGVSVAAFEDNPAERSE